MINVVWALAKTDYNGNGNRRSRMLLDNIAKSAMDHLEDFSPEQLSRLMWSYSTLHHYVKPLFDAVATEIIRQVSVAMLLLLQCWPVSFPCLKSTVVWSENDRCSVGWYCS